MAILRAEVRRFDFERMECPAWGERFVPVPSQPVGFECSGLYINYPHRACRAARAQGTTTLLRPPGAKRVLAQVIHEQF